MEKYALNRGEVSQTYGEDATIRYFMTSKACCEEGIAQGHRAQGTCIYREGQNRVVDQLL